MSRGLHIPTDPSQWGFKGKNYLFTIGIDAYLHWKPLNNAVKDVDDIVKILTERYQFEQSNVRSLRNSEATEDGIREELIKVKRVISKDDNLIVCFSGHGYFDEDIEEGYWVPVDAHLDKPSNYISNSDLLKWIRAIETHHTFIMIDACFCGTLISQSRSSVLSEKYPSSRVFASGRKELVDDGVPGANSPFAKAIISTLNRNVERVMRASDLISSVTKQVEFDAGQEPIDGRIKDARDEGGEFVFHLKVTEEEIWESVVVANTGESYSKYIDYFPDGVHAHDARDRMRQLTDDKDWRHAINLNSKSSLTEYLESHPNGAHYEIARTTLEDLEEESAWQNARTKGAISGFLEYLRGYPEGKFSREAKRQIDLQKSEMHSDGQEQLEDDLRDARDAGRVGEEDKKQYKSIIKEAEAHFAEGRYAESIVKYEFALGIYQSTFVPESAFVQERLKRAKRGIEYGKFLSEGKIAVTEGKYHLALDNLQKAQEIEDTVKIRDWIKHVSGKIAKQGQTEDRSVFQKEKIPQKRKKGIGRPIIVGATALLIIIVFLVWYMNSNDTQDYDDPVTTDWETEDLAADNDDVIKGGTLEEQNATADIQRPEQTYSEPNSGVSLGVVLVGSWYVFDRVVYQQSMRNSGNLIEAYYDFYNNGVMTYTVGSYPYTQVAQGTWYLNNNQLTVSIPGLGNFTGIVTSFNSNEIIWATEEPGFTSLVYNTFRRN